MPLTLAHPAAVLPLVRQRLAASALVIGSLAPDFLYFVPAGIDHNFGHTLLGLVVFSVPAGLVALWVFHGVLKQPCLSLLPVSQQSVLAPVAGEFRFGPWRRLLMILFSLALGALTHVVWDSFTHERGVAVANVAWLKAVLVETPYGRIRVFKLLQHASTVLGASILIYWYLRWAKHRREAGVEISVHPQGRTIQAVIWALSLTALALGLGYAYLRSSQLAGLKWAQAFANRSIVASIAGLSAELFLFSIFWHVIASRKKSAPQSVD